MVDCIGAWERLPTLSALPAVLGLTKSMLDVAFNLNLAAFLMLSKYYLLAVSAACMLNEGQVDGTAISHVSRLGSCWLSFLLSAFTCLVVVVALESWRIGEGHRLWKVKLKTLVG